MCKVNEGKDEGKEIERAGTSRLTERGIKGSVEEEGKRDEKGLKVGVGRGKE